MGSRTPARSQALSGASLAVSLATRTRAAAAAGGREPRPPSTPPTLGEDGLSVTFTRRGQRAYLRNVSQLRSRVPLATGTETHPKARPPALSPSGASGHVPWVTLPGSQPEDRQENQDYLDNFRKHFQPSPVDFLLGKWSVSQGWRTTCAGKEQGRRQGVRAGGSCSASRPPPVLARCSSPLPAPGIWDETLVAGARAQRR